MYKRTIETRSRNHCCRGKAISIIYYLCVSATLTFPARKAHILHYITICGPSGYTKLFHIHLTNGTIFGGGGCC